jgi:hypothetical protein
LQAKPGVKLMMIGGAFDQFVLLLLLLPAKPGVKLMTMRVHLISVCCC